VYEDLAAALGNESNNEERFVSRASSWVCLGLAEIFVAVVVKEVFNFRELCLLRSYQTRTNTLVFQELRIL
jgi:rhamnogalacturonyl hydrolase YesR